MECMGRIGRARVGWQWGGRVRRFIGVSFARRAGAQRSRGGELGLGGRAPTSCRHANGKAGSADVLVGMRMEKLTWGVEASFRWPRILRATGTSPAPDADGDVSAPKITGDRNHQFSLAALCERGLWRRFEGDAWRWRGSLGDGPRGCCPAQWVGATGASV
jgi:hypothetical protein